MTRNTSAVAVCCSSVSVRSSVRWRNSLSSRAFSICEILHQRDLFIGKRPYLLTVDRYVANQIAFLKHRDDKKRTDTSNLGASDCHRMAFNSIRILLSEIGNMHGLLRSGSPRGGSVLA